MYLKYGKLEQVLCKHDTPINLQRSIHHFKKVFFAIEQPNRTLKHVSDPYKGSTAKRINTLI